MGWASLAPLRARPAVNLAIAGTQRPTRPTRTSDACCTAWYLPTPRSSLPPGPVVPLALPGLLAVRRLVVLRLVVPLAVLRLVVLPERLGAPPLAEPCSCPGRPCPRCSPPRAWPSSSRHRRGSTRCRPGSARPGSTRLPRRLGSFAASLRISLSISAVQSQLGGLPLTHCGCSLGCESCACSVVVSDTRRALAYGKELGLERPAPRRSLYSFCGQKSTPLPASRPGNCSRRKKSRWGAGLRRRHSPGRQPACAPTSRARPGSVQRP